MSYAVYIIIESGVEIMECFGNNWNNNADAQMKYIVHTNYILTSIYRFRE